MKLKLKVLILVSLLFITAVVSTPKTFAGENSITDKDKTAVVKSMLERRVKGWDKKSLEAEFLSTENIKAEWIPKIKGVKLKLLKPYEIEEKIKQGESCLIFTQFEVIGSKIMVTLESRFNSYINSQTYEYSKINGKWVGQWSGFSDTMP